MCIKFKMNLIRSKNLYIIVTFQMCYYESNRFDKEDTAELGWSEPTEPPPTYEELETQYFN